MFETVCVYDLEVSFRVVLYADRFSFTMALFISLSFCAGKEFRL